jgi:aryl-alcohol dehydrogenase-like predicted oxidoreductase
MEHVTLGRTALRVSRMGLGGGGHSRLGKRSGIEEQQSIQIVRRAIDLGVNFIDTAESYGTEEIVGQGMRGRPRDRVVISTKKTMWGDRMVSPSDLRGGLEESLRRLGTDYIDVYHLHGLKVEQYRHARDALVPEMLKLRDEGKIRAVGVTEAFNSDRNHAMLKRAMQDDCWDVIMVGFNILNQSARELVLAAAQRKSIGVLCMFAVRAALSRPARLVEVVRELVDAGKIDRAAVDDLNDPLKFLTRDGVAGSVTEAAYRFCRDEPGMHVVLSGTGNVEHLEANAGALSASPLPEAIRLRLMNMFQGVDNVSGQ